MTLCRLSRHI